MSQVAFAQADEENTDSPNDGARSIDPDVERVLERTISGKATQSPDQIPEADQSEDAGNDRAVDQVIQRTIGTKAAHKKAAHRHVSHTKPHRSEMDRTAAHSRPVGRQAPQLTSDAPLTSDTPVPPAARDETARNRAPPRSAEAMAVAPNAGPGADGAGATDHAHVVAPDAPSGAESEGSSALSADSSATAAPQAPAVTGDDEGSTVTVAAQYLPDWIRKMSGQAAVAWLAGIGFVIALVAGALNSRREID